MFGLHDPPFKAPWWVDSVVFGAAYIQGRLHAIGKLPDNARDARPRQISWQVCFAQPLRAHPDLG
jgi:hypothetical protein